MSIAMEMAARRATASGHSDESPQRDDAQVPAVDAVLSVLGELSEFVRTLTDEQYTRQPVGPFKSSIGGHVRHCLDHVASVVTAAATGVLNYDDRERGTSVERDRSAALELMERQQRALLGLRVGFADRRLQMTSLICADAPPIHAATSLCRELSFVVSHTVHHNSLIAAAAALMGVPVPERFGYAPATIAWMNETPCAR